MQGILFLIYLSYFTNYWSWSCYLIFFFCFYIFFTAQSSTVIESGCLHAIDEDEYRDQDTGEYENGDENENEDT